MSHQFSHIDFVKLSGEDRLNEMANHNRIKNQHPIICNLFLFVFLVSGYIRAETIWQTINPIPTIKTLYDCYIFNDDRMIVIGEGGTIYITENSGQEWNQIYTGITSTFKAITFLDIEGWIVGNNGTVLYSSDWGTSWEITIHGNHNFHQIQFVNELNGWIRSTDYVVLKTQNGGITWDELTVPSSFPLNDIHFLNPDTGYITAGDYANIDSVTIEGELLKTEDGGATWDVLDSGNVYYDNIFFLDNNVGWLKKSQLDSNAYLVSNLLYTSNGGEDWQIMGNALHIDEVIFSDNLNGLAYGSHGISTTNNGGQSWVQLYDTNLGFSIGGLQTKESKILTVGSFGNIVYSENFGDSWTHLDKRLDIYWPAFNDILFIDNNHGWIVGKQYDGPADTSLVLITNDGGDSWERSFSPSSLAAVFAIDENIVWGIGGSKAFISNDGGYFWTDVNVQDVYWIFRDIYFFNLNKGLLLDSEQLFSTIDGGDTWSLIYTFPGVQFVRSIAIADSSNWWVIGHHAGGGYPTFRSTDLGNTWEIYSQTFEDIYFLNSQTGWAHHEDKSIHRTDDGGNSWYQVSTNPTSLGVWTSRLHFTDENHGWLIGSFGSFFTTDGGITWNRYHELSGIRSGSFIDSTTGWVQGNNGLIMRLESDDVVKIGDEQDGITIQNFTQSQNYPNPFNPTTIVQYELPYRSNVQITIYDLLGRKVTTLLSETQDTGIKSTTWNATNDHGKPVSAGVYLYQIRAGEFVQTRKMLLLKNESFE